MLERLGTRRLSKPGVFPVSSRTRRLLVSRIKEVLHTIVSTVVSVVTLPFRAVAKLLRPRR